MEKNEEEEEGKGDVKIWVARKAARGRGEKLREGKNV